MPRQRLVHLEYLYELGKYKDAMWHDYLGKLEAAGASRDKA